MINNDTSILQFVFETEKGSWNAHLAAVWDHTVINYANMRSYRREKHDLQWFEMKTEKSDNLSSSNYSCDGI